MLTITKVTAGSGTTVSSASILANTRQTLTVGSAEVVGQTATLPVTLVESRAQQDYALTELGVYARDPDEGEVLYQVFRLSEERTITAGGEHVYRFYLRQTVGTGGVSVTCSPAGLITEEDLHPVRSKVFATNSPTHSVMVTAEELAAYVAALPRILGEDLTITVSGGTVSSTLSLIWITGPGRLFITAADGEMVTLAQGAYIVNCSALIYLTGLIIEPVDSVKAAVYVYASPSVALSKCVINGNEVPNVCGILSTMASVTYARECTVVNCAYGLEVGHGSIGGLYSCTAENNITGIRTGYGGIAILSGTTPQLLGGSAHICDGPIFKGGVLL